MQSLKALVVSNLKPDSLQLKDHNKVSFCALSRPHRHSNLFLNITLKSFMMSTKLALDLTDGEKNLIIYAFLSLEQGSSKVSVFFYP